MPTPLTEEPTARPRNLAELTGIAAAMEAEAEARYRQLALEMERQDEAALAALFRTMAAEERDHLAAVTAWSVQATGAAPSPALWDLPPDIARSWKEIAGSALLTPYRALAIAVLNEERGFAFYTYIAAHAVRETVRLAAERLALEELSHAAALRRERRRAYRREHPASVSPLAECVDAEDLQRRARAAEAEAAALHAALAAGLAAHGDAMGAEVLRTVAAAERQVATPLATAAAAPSDLPEEGVAMLRAGLAAAERLHDAYLDVLERAADEACRRLAETGAARAAHHLALIAARLHAPAR